MQITPFYSGRMAYDITADNGEKYVFVPKEFAEKGFVLGNTQYYEPAFLQKGAFDTAKSFTLPNDSAITSAAKSLFSNPTQGYIWKASDFAPLNTDNFSFQGYEITSSTPAIKNIGNVGGSNVYVTESAPGYPLTYLSGVGEFTSPAFSTPRYGGFLAGLARDVAPILPIALAFIAPGIGSAIAAELVAAEVLTSAAAAESAALAAGATATEAAAAAASATAMANTVGNIIASTALQTAAGADFDKALQNALTSAVVQTGSVAAAKEINTALTTVINDPAAADIIAKTSNAAGSAIASAATTAARGGSQDDIIQAALGGAAGSVATDVTGKAAIGGAVKGGILGGTQGALMGAAAALGSEAWKQSSQPKQVSAYQSVQDAISSANLTPEEATAVRQAMQDVYAGASTAQALPLTTTDVGGGAATRLGSPFASNDPRFVSAMEKNPNLFKAFSEYTNTYGFSSASIPAYKSLLEQELAKTPADQNLLEEYKKITGKDYQQTLPETGAGAGRGTVSPPVVTPEAPAPTPEAPNIGALEDLTKTGYTPPEATIPISGAEPTPVVTPEAPPEAPPVTPEAPPAVEPIAGAPEVTPTPVVTPYTPEITAPVSYIVATVDSTGTRALVYDNMGNPSTVTIPEGVKIEPNQTVNVDTSTGSIVSPKTAVEPSPAAGVTPAEPPSPPPAPPSTTPEPVVTPQPVPEEPKTPAGTTTGTTTTTTTPTEPGAGAGTVTPVTPISETTPEKTPEDATEREGTLAKETPVTDEYKPSITTATKVSPKTTDFSKAALTKVLRADMASPISTTGLTAYRPAGEIESEETGKRRQDVWNEASLRLKDALGL